MALPWRACVRSEITSTPEIELGPFFTLALVVDTYAISDQSHGWILSNPQGILPASVDPRALSVFRA
jgi:hypothetical protein